MTQTIIRNLDGWDRNNLMLTQQGQFINHPNQQISYIKNDETFSLASEIHNGNIPSNQFICRLRTNIDNNQEILMDLYSLTFLSDRYLTHSALGHGSFGQVVKCLDVYDFKFCAVKILNLSKSSSSHFAEINTLKYINKHDTDNLFVKYYNYFRWKNCDCIVFELLGGNLYDYLRYKTNFTGMVIDDVQTIACQLLMALAKLASLGIIHCDIKPENIALIEGSGYKKIKLIDFGSSCTSGQTIYRYIQSRFYRAPEVILELGYDKEIDVWSVACVIAELITGVPIFPGNDEGEQLGQFTQVLGSLPEKLVRASPKHQKYFSMINNSLILNSFGNKHYLPFTHPLHFVILKNNDILNYFQQKLPSHYEKIRRFQACDLLSRMFQYHSKERITATDALTHSFFKTVDCQAAIDSIIATCSSNSQPVLYTAINYPHCLPMKQQQICFQYPQGYVYVDSTQLPTVDYGQTAYIGACDPTLSKYYQVIKPGIIYNDNCMQAVNLNEYQQFIDPSPIIQPTTGIHYSGGMGYCSCSECLLNQSMCFINPLISSSNHFSNS